MFCLANHNKSSQYLKIKSLSKMHRYRKVIPSPNESVRIPNFFMPAGFIKVKFYFKLSSAFDLDVGSPNIRAHANSMDDFMVTEVTAKWYLYLSREDTPNFVAGPVRLFRYLFVK